MSANSLGIALNANGVGETTVSVSSGNVINAGGIAINVNSFGLGAATVSSGSLITAGGAAINVNAVGDATVNVSSGVFVTAAGVGISANGVGVAAVNVSTGSYISAAGIGISANSVGTTDVNSGAEISAAGIGIQAAGVNDVTVSTSTTGTINVAGIGITADSSSGSIRVSASGEINASVGNGINASTSAGSGESVSVTASRINASDVGIQATANSGADISVRAQSINAGSHGITTESSSGSVSIRTDGTIESTGGNAVRATATSSNVTLMIENTSSLRASGDAVVINTTSGAVLIDQEGRISSSGGDGINVSASGSARVNLETDLSAANAGVRVASSGAIEINHFDNARITTVSGPGIEAGSSGGAVTIKQLGVVNAGGTGISVTGGSNATVDAHNTITSGGDGINATSSGITTITQSAAAPITAGGSGIVGASTGGPVIITQNAAVTANGGHGLAITQAGAGASVINQNAVVNASQSGIFAANIAGSLTGRVGAGITAGLHGIDVTAAGDVDFGTVSQTIVAGQDGIRIGSTAGTVTLTHDGSLAVGRDGIVIQGTGGAGTSMVTANSAIVAPRNAILGTNINGPLVLDVNVPLTAGSGNGIDLSGNTPSISVDTAGTITALAGTGIRLDTPAAAANVVINGPVAAMHGVDATIDNGAISLNAALTAQTLGISVANATGAHVLVAATGSISVANDHAIDASGGPVLITNNGTITGFVTLTNSDDVFQNNSAQTWYTHSAGTTGSTSNFNGGNDILNNAGRIVAARSATIVETVNFLGLENFNNGDPASVGAGLLTLQDGGVDDTLFTSGNFSGVGNSRLAIDAFLGAPGSTADRLVVAGSTSGSTGIVVNNTNPGPGAYNPVGIVVVPVTGTTDASHFHLVGGPINRSLFTYDLYLRPDNTHVLASVPGQQAFEMPRVTTTIQSISHDSLGIASERQAEVRDQASFGCRSSTGYETGNGSVAGRDTPCSPLWFRSFGSLGARDKTDQIALFNKTSTYDVSYSQASWGALVGLDGALTGVLGSNDKLLAGIFGGYVGGNVRFDASSTKIDVAGGTGGIHLGYMNGILFVDALLKGDRYGLDYSSSALAPFGPPSADSAAVVLAGRGDLGLRFATGSASAIEAMASVKYANTTMDGFDIAGNRVEFEPGDSLRAGAALRASGDLGTIGTWVMTGSLSATYWFELEGMNEVRIINPGPTAVLHDKLDGSFGEFTGALGFATPNSGWSGFSTFGYTVGSGYGTGRVTIGQRYRW